MGQRLAEEDDEYDHAERDEREVGRLAPYGLQGRERERPQIVRQDEITDEHSPDAGDRTAPAETSLASLASGWYSPVARSTTNSRAVLNSSVTKTRSMVRTRTASSSFLTPTSRLATRTKTATMTWKRMLRWVRTHADHTPVGVLEAAGYALLTFVRSVTLLATQLLHYGPLDPLPSHWPRILLVVHAAQV